MKIAVLLAVFCYAQLTSGVTHRLQYFYTATTGISNFPAFVDVGVVDGVAVSRYDSNTQKKVPLQRWMEENFDQQYWESSTTNLKGTEQWFKYYIETAKKRFNHTGGVHTFQRMYGCQWDDETQAIDGFDQYGYDGKDFITFDLKNLHYIAPVPENLITKQKLDTNTALLEGQKHYYTQTCIDWLKKYVQYGSSTLGRKVAPEVSLLQKGSGVACHATGFYPEGVMITWKKDGEEMQDDVDVGETLPNEDGTFQKRAVLTVSPEERKKGQYSCEVTHKSGGPIVMVFEEASHLPIIIAVCVVAAVALVAGIVAVVIMKKKGYTKAPQSDTSSDTSNGAPKA